MNTGPFFALLALIALLGGGIGSVYAVVTDDGEVPPSGTQLVPGQGFGGQLPGSGTFGGQTPGEQPQSDDGSASAIGGGTGPGFGGGGGGFGANIRFGTVVSLTGGVLTIDTPEGQRSVTVNSDTSVVNTSTVGDSRGLLTAGTQVSALGQTAADGTTTAARLTLGAGGGAFGGFGGGGRFGGGAFAGTIVSLEGDTLVIDTGEGSNSVLLTDGTVVVIQSSIEDAPEELTGAEVTVVATAGDDGSLTAVIVATGVDGFGGFGGGSGRFPGGGRPQP